MATEVLQFSTEEQRSVVRFFFVCKFTQYKDMFPLYGGKCLSHKAVHKCVEKSSQSLSKFANDARPGADVAETTVRRHLFCGFRPTGKAMGQVYQCRSRICREINILSMLEYHIFYVFYPFVIYFLAFLRMLLLRRLCFTPRRNHSQNYSFFTF
jgi:hypothetical protein